MISLGDQNVFYSSVIEVHILERYIYLIIVLHGIRQKILFGIKYNMEDYKNPLQNYLINSTVCIVSLKRSARPGRTGLLELLRLLCATVTVFFLLNPEWRRTVEPAKQPEIIILHDESGSMSTSKVPVF